MGVSPVHHIRRRLTPRAHRNPNNRRTHTRNRPLSHSNRHRTRTFSFIALIPLSAAAFPTRTLLRHLSALWQPFVPAFIALVNVPRNLSHRAHCTQSSPILRVRCAHIHNISLTIKHLQGIGGRGEKRLAPSPVPVLGWSLVVLGWSGSFSGSGLAGGNCWDWSAVVATF